MAACSSRAMMPEMAPGKPVRQSVVAKAVVVDIDEAKRAAGFENRAQIPDDLKAFPSVVFEDESDPDKIELPEVV